MIETKNIKSLSNELIDVQNNTSIDYLQKKSIFEEDSREPKDKIILSFQAQLHIQRLNKVFYQALQKNISKENIHSFVYDSISKKSI